MYVINIFHFLSSLFFFSHMNAACYKCNIHNMTEVKVKKMAPYWLPLYALTSDWLLEHNSEVRS